jgi:hypothetical protein
MQNGVAVEAVRSRTHHACGDFGGREPTQSRRTRATSTLEIAGVLLDYVAGPSWYASRPELFSATCVIRQDRKDQGRLKRVYRGVEVKLLILLAL